MARPKKVTTEDAGELMVSVESYTRTRDSVIVSLSNLQAGLAHVQSGLNELLRAYLEHTNSVIAGEDGVLEKLNLGKEIAATANATIEAASTANGIAQAISAADKDKTEAAAEKPGKGTKRKREKKEKDPNAPKKPLTAAFLYAQTARPIVRGDLEAALGPDQKLEPNAVNLEVNKRWNEMTEEDKETWRQSYRDSMEQWKEEMKTYTASKGVAAADLHDDDEEEAEAEVEVEAVAESDDSSGDDEPAPAKAPSPPVKTPRANKRQKIAEKPAVNGAAQPVVAAASPIPLPRSTSTVAHPSSVTETPAKKEKKKKEKAAPQAIAPAPAAAAKETSPDEGSKKKTKSSRSTRNNEPEASADKENVAAPEKEKKKRERKRKLYPEPNDTADNAENAALLSLRHKSLLTDDYLLSPLK
ncbi:hypothetical protein N0V87_003724 [Didymella glomerata]|uniref:HMG box domain-containing protein n=1 Tax=Didymella glomerata TaxID=749621 RepID=A0A9W9C181_9PLEO|nr:hypothetical protein N0V87_003724 [Didymella glomerata]